MITSTELYLLMLEELENGNEALLSAYDSYCKLNGRSNVGLSKSSINEVRELIDAQLLTESPDRVDANVFGKKPVEKRSHGWPHGRCMAFTFSKETRKCYVSDYKNSPNRTNYLTHTDIPKFYRDIVLGKARNADLADLNAEINIDDIPKDRLAGDFSGRLWMTFKEISFWNYPKMSELKQYLDKIEKEVRLRHNVMLDFSDGSWLIDVPKTPKNDVFVQGKVMQNRNGLPAALFDLKDILAGKKPKYVGKRYAWLNLGIQISQKDKEVAHMLAPIIKQQKKMAGGEVKLDDRSRKNLIQYYQKKDRAAGDLENDEKAFYHMLRVMK